MNELTKQENNTLELLENIPMEVLSQYIQQKVNNQLTAKVKEIDEKITEHTKAITNLHTATLETQQNIIDYTQATGHVKQLVHSEEYVNKTNLGKNYRLKISPQRVGKLLKYSGILQKHNNEPYIQYLEGKKPLVVRNKFINNGYEGYKTHFHQQRTWDKIYKKLEDNDLYFDFFNCQTKSELNDFIDSLEIE